MLAGTRKNKLRASLNDKMTLGGVDKKLALINGVLTASLVLPLQQPWFILIGFAVHSILAALNKRDPYLREAYMKYSKQGDRYDPWPGVDTSRNERTVGKKTLC